MAEETTCIELTGSARTKKPTKNLDAAVKFGMAIAITRHLVD
ncbi:hypothetical protein [Sphingopyxis sp.]|nr:hypothetical protein [Sphingopyxis sp.]HJS12189.1 hypothetical protein [Sphingopyxis sp.]